MDCQHFNPALFIIIAWAVVTVIGEAAKQRRRVRRQELEREIEVLESQRAAEPPPSSREPPPAATPQPSPRPSFPAPRLAAVPAGDAKHQAWLDKGRRAERPDDVLRDQKDGLEWDSDWDLRSSPLIREPRTPTAAIATATATVAVAATVAASAAATATATGAVAAPRPLPQGRALAALCRDAVVWRDLFGRARSL